MRRILCTVEYDGTAYAGWQRQLNGLAVQQVLEEALSRATGAPGNHHRRQPHGRRGACHGSNLPF